MTESEYAVTCIDYYNSRRFDLILNSKLNGKTFREILEPHIIGHKISSIDIHDGSWHCNASVAKVLDAVYDHTGERFSKSGGASINFMDIAEACNISSGGGLRIFGSFLVQKSKSTDDS